MCSDLALRTARLHDLRPTIARMMLAAGLSGVRSWAPGALPNGYRPGPTSSPRAGCTSRNMPKCVPRPVPSWGQYWSARGGLAWACWTYVLLCLSSLASAVWLYQFHREYDASFLVATFLLGACTASFYGWLPLYLPELFRTSVRATGQDSASTLAGSWRRSRPADRQSDGGIPGGATIAGVSLPGGSPLARTTTSMVTWWQLA